MKNKKLSVIGYIVCLITCAFFLASCDGEIEQMDKRLQMEIDKLNDSSKIELAKSNYPYLFKRIHYQNGLIQFGNDRYWIRAVYPNWYSLSCEADTTKKISLEVINDTLLIMRKATTFINVFDVDGIQLRLINYANSNATLFVRNISGKKFAYADLTQINTGEVTASSLKFSSSDTLTIHVLGGSHLIFYEFATDEKNQLILKAKAGVPYLAGLFHL